MKIFLLLTLFVALAAAELPAYRQQYYFAQQKEEAAPYQPSGWKPDGPEFNLPQKQQVENTYGPPKQQYGPPQASALPQNQYGPLPAPAGPQNQYGPPPAAPQNQYGQPFPPQNQIALPAAPQNQFGVSQNQFGTPQNQFGAPQQQFGFPQRQFGAPQKFRSSPAPQKQYVPQNPTQQYGLPNTPQTSYGVPEFTTTEIPDFADNDEPTTVRGLTESESEPVNSVNELGSAEGEVDEQQQKSGQYFVALPDGRLQRVRYVSREDVEAMKYFAKIRAENVEPLRGPIYSYAPLQKLQIAPGALEVSVSAPVSVESSKPEKLIAPSLEIQPLAQVQYQLDSPGNAVPLTSSFTSYNANYQVPTPNDQRYIVAL